MAEMMERRFEARVLQIIRRHGMACVLGLYVLLVLWGGLVPFDFTWPTGLPVEDTFLGLPRSPTHTPDIASNIALYIPIGVLVAAVASRRGWRLWGTLAAAALLGAAISYLVEIIQVFLPSRVSSLADLQCNILGAASGAMALRMCRVTVAVTTLAGRRTAQLWREMVRARPCAVAAQICAGMIVLGSLAPFDVTFSPDRVYASFKQTQLRPFSQYSAALNAVTFEAERDGHASSEASYVVWQIRLDCIWVLGAYAVLSALLYRYLGRHCAVTGLRRSAWILATCLILSTGATAARLFVISRDADVTDPILAAGGAVVGMLLAPWLVRTWLSAGGRSRVFSIALTLCVAFTVARQLAPCRPNLALDSIAGRVGDIDWVPFRTYQRALLPTAVRDMLGKLALCGAIAGLLCMRRLTRDGRPAGVVAAGLTTAGVVAALEVLQILIPPRFPATTDILLALAGGLAGAAVVRIAAWYAAEQSRPYYSVAGVLPHTS